MPAPATNRPLGSGDPVCHFAGQDEPDALRNGYVMTRWLVGTVAAWTCFSDFLGHIAVVLVNAGYIPPDGTVVAITDPNSKPDDPTAISVLRSGTQTTVELYFHDNVDPGLFLSWDNGGGSLSGRLVVLTDHVSVDPSENLNIDAEAPTHLRVDFTRGGGVRTAKMFMAFDPYGQYNGSDWTWFNPWATGFRVDAEKTLGNGWFDIKGIIAAKAQPDSGYPGPEKPQIKMATVSNWAGKGGSVARVVDAGLGLRIDPNEFIGYFRYDKDDTYYFLANGTPEYVNKSVTSADYLAGTEAYTDYDDALVDTALSTIIPAGTTGDCKAGVAGACVTFLDALFDLGPWGYDSAVGIDPPVDNRSAALASPAFLTQTTPDDKAAGDWTDVFDLSFTP